MGKRVENDLTMITKTMAKTDQHDESDDNDDDDEDEIDEFDDQPCDKFILARK